MSRARELAGFATATNPIQDLNVGVVTAISFSGDGSSSVSYTHLTLPTKA